MQRIFYASGNFLTDDQIAIALMDYARVLAIVNSADVVRLPSLDEGGEVRWLQLVIGPASQILAAETGERQVDMPVEETIKDLRRRSQERLPDTSELMQAGLDPDEPEATALNEGTTPRRD